jgi:hypothetical protein
MPPTDLDGRNNPQHHEDAGKEKRETAFSHEVDVCFSQDFEHISYLSPNDDERLAVMSDDRDDRSRDRVCR